MPKPCPRPEHPRPSVRRPAWRCLNGEWEFAVDRGDSGEERGLVQAAYTDRITVPFCPESELSGIGDTDFLNAVWYRRREAIPADWRGTRVLLHFQAVDHDATVWIDGERRARHRGGWTPFTVDLGSECAGCEIEIVLRARDDHRERKAAGKQSHHYANSGCHYTRTTGIWQTVWLEAVPATAHLERPWPQPDLANRRIRLRQPVRGAWHGRVRATASFAGSEVVAAEAEVAGAAVVDLDLALGDQARVWSPEDPALYDLVIELLDAEGQAVDRIESYAGLRSVGIAGNRLTLNGEVRFQRLVLDQGYYPDGIMTAPDDAALVRDIELSQACGFDGARLHQKVFEERFLYHADRLGYLVWGEIGDWGYPYTDPGPGLVAEWTEALERDRGHPCIVGWCPLNETGLDRRWFVEADGLRDLTAALYQTTKLVDPARPCLDASGWVHCIPAEVYDIHTYEQDPERLKAALDGLLAGRTPPWGGNGERCAEPYRGQPFLVSEFGGARWDPRAASAVQDRQVAWGYGQAPGDIEEWFARFRDQCTVLLEHPAIAGYCFTQLTDVFQECNGVLDFARQPKLPVARFAAVQRRRAAIEDAGD